ncbi:MAG TPA: M43 family zinc metalloprotease [Flavisolibacter sp.]|jgi:hypothetical protein|nr:M43 family zinc metalloprotease [Flavisolibacter sp.]
MRAIFLCVVFLVSCAGVSAQRACVAAQYNEIETSRNPAQLRAQKAVEDFIQQRALQSTAHSSQVTASLAPVLTIPVVVHVLYNNDIQNISDEQVISGIEALNRDFRRMNSDTINTPLAFKSVAADTRIEFVLATADPAGRSTNGINRKRTAVTEWKMDDKIKMGVHGGIDPWDTRSYLNIWVGHMRSLLGYASAPGSSAEKDGVVITTSAFGLKNVRAPYDLGRTTVHEVGHWLGLKHIWGDSYCGDDGIHDTPRQGNFTAGCPKGFRTSCDNGSTGDMYMNYMDFTDDACMNLFTEGQKDRMRALFFQGGPRAGLISSKGLGKPWAQPVVLEEVVKPVLSSQFKLYPNPASSEIMADFGSDTWIGKDVSLFSAEGILLRKERVLSRNQKISLLGLKPGLYFLKGSNGAHTMNQKIVKF